ncbi:MAG: hypothetical protein KIS78_09585 [Labilithrix sp.]|nr:hypothetical protein [Labilithrix sp.]
MGRNSASLKASGGEERRPGGRPSNQWRRPAGPNADGAPTLRNLIPWQDMEKKLAERLAEKAARGELSSELEKDGDVPSKRPPWKNDVEPAPDSGVRASEVGPARELTYSVYTVADLDSLAPSRPPRMSTAPAPAPAPASRWADTGKAALALVQIVWAHALAPKPRPRLRDVAEVPSRLFLTELGRSLRAMPWKRISAGTGIALGTLLVLLFVVLTAAELTDDLKPARATATSARSAMESAAIPATAAAPAAPATTPLATAETKPIAPRPAEAAPSEAIEIDDAAPAPAKPKPKAKKPAKKKKAVELFKP